MRLSLFGALPLVATLAALVLGTTACSDDADVLPDRGATVDAGTGDASGPDVAPMDRGPVVDQAGGDRSAADTTVTDLPASDVRWHDVGSAFPCGAKSVCGFGQYCSSMGQGMCGGAPVPDSGLCPPDCQPTTCPNGQYVCICTTYQCKNLPSGCSDCTCLKQANPGCMCKSQYGGLYLECAAP